MTGTGSPATALSARAQRPGGQRQDGPWPANGAGHGNEVNSTGNARPGRDVQPALALVRGEQDDPASVLAAQRALTELCPGWRARRRERDGRWRARRQGNVYLRHGSPRAYLVTAPTALTLLVLIEHQSLLDMAEQHPGWTTSYTAADGWWARWTGHGEADEPLPGPAMYAPTATALLAALAQPGGPENPATPAQAS